MKASGCNLDLLGERMKTAREALGLTQAAFHEKYGYGSVRTYQKNEAGLNEAGISLAASFVHAGINANWLLTGEGPMLLKDLQAPSENPPPAQPVDLELMRGLLQMLEEELEKRDRDLGPASKARLVAVLYDCAVKLGALDPAMMRNVLDLAA